MVTIDNHPAIRDQQHPESRMCWRCHLPITHPVHGPKDKSIAIKGTATPDKVG
jgi:hypothetical protein